MLIEKIDLTKLENIKDKKSVNSRTDGVFGGESVFINYLHSFLDEQDNRYMKIFGVEDVKKISPPDKNAHRRYFDYLSQNIPIGTKLTGTSAIGYFSWEDSYDEDEDENDEYHNMKLERGSYKDIYSFLGVDCLEAEVGTIVKVERINDKKVFHIPLEDMEGCDEIETVNEIVKDYAYWMMRYS